MNNDRLDPDVIDQTTKNIDLLGRFLQEALADETILATIPNNGTVVLMPPNDPDLARRNLALSEKASATGQNVRLQRVGIPATDHVAWRATEIRSIEMRSLGPHWPPNVAPEAGDLIVVYDRDRDVLSVDFFGLRRVGVGMPIAEGMAVRVELESEEIVGYLLGAFLNRVVLKAPHLTSLLRIADLRELTAEELGGLEPPPAPRPGPATEHESAEALANEFGKLRIA